ncbi:hypothetical protein DEU56DRAFT_564909 [Suillus clintonianus]|uniref:uncharacterized protein n=1 Tax=Suillus clintonianus TaxID=1904413 RepID=UPI001B887301|nr:uncharacterized protein DEU56DRAFT_564909 [Suillus clintonianus]KAG2125760.1 hypothetical protein DEU56DRAFT_564909 [Suillus clintonianus]
MADVSDKVGSVADQIVDPSGSEEPPPDELNAVARENALKVERNRRRAERRADVADLAAVSDDEPLIEVTSRTTSPAPAPPETPSSVDPSSSLATHPALQNIDIIRTICLYVHDGSLPALASTCRIFEHPALDVLWRNLQSVQPLVKCLPSDLFSIEKGHIVLLKPLDTKMWDILHKYTSRVHSITQSGRLAVIEPLGSVMLSCPSAPASLFPNLRRLIWHDADGTHCAAEFLRMALVPTLEYLKIQISSASSIFLSVLSSLGTFCPNLQTMIVNLSPSAINRDDLLQKASPFISQSISQLQRLQRLFVWDLGNQGMKHVMQLQALQRLWLDLSVPSTWGKRSHLRFPGFQNLDRLDLFIDNLEHATDFLSSLQVIRCKKITIHFELTTVNSSASKSTTPSPFFSILGKICDHDNLESFAIPETPENIHTKPSVFAPLHKCRNLTRLLIEHSWKISMTDQELCQLVRGWPKLQVLSFSKFVTIDDTTIPTFHGLISLLQLCPALTSLTLVVDATTLDGIDFRSPGGGACSRDLKELVLSNSPIKSPLNVALIFSGLFPNLQEVDLDCWDSAPATLPRQSQAVKKQWEEVNLTLFSFSVVKERRVEV